MSKDNFPQYTTDYISGVMSLRKPQRVSLEILANILNEVPLSKTTNRTAALESVKSLYSTCTDFERDFMSLTFALATGVGKTRLMGAFIAYLYTQHDIHNFFVVAPNTTIYEKLKKDLSDPGNPKYVFRGLGCFAVSPPHVISDDDYREKTISLFDADVNIFAFNIDKFNKENAKMRSINEYLGQSFFDELAALDDLVLIMDESHHYRAERGAQALNDLRPVLGLELTATPLVTKGGKPVPFKNVVFEYPLSRAIEDGYTRTPFAVTRSDIDFYNFGDEQLDKLMLSDGIACHEKAKRRLEAYAANHPGKPLVKPFMLVVCKDTAHAEWVEEYIKSDAFRDGAYRTKTITVHSKLKGAESEANLRLLLSVEDPDNPIEIVIHVNMLKEGWDVNNLYTIVPLRTAASKILREQMVGRGLRLPYGERTGDPDVDAVMLTAHDKFKELLEEAQRGDSIFKAGNVIHAEDIQPEESGYPQIAIDGFSDTEAVQTAYVETGIDHSDAASQLFQEAHRLIADKVTEQLCDRPEHKVTSQQEEEIAAYVTEQLSQRPDLGQIYADNKDPLLTWTRQEVKRIHKATVDKFIPIPKIKVTDAGAEEYCFTDFDLDLNQFQHAPIENTLEIQNLLDMSDRQRIHGERIDFDGYEPKRVILEQLRQKPEIDYERCSELLFKLITQLCVHYENQYGSNGMKNIVMMYKRDIGNLIYNQMMQHFYRETGFLKEEVIGTSKVNLRPRYTWESEQDLFDSFSGNIRDILFTGIKHGVFETAKFDSEPELLLARVLERDKDEVQNWLRPAPREFNITYNHGKHYQPDFVVETAEMIYLVEVKGEDKLNDPDVLAKKQRGIQYCEVVSHWNKANGYKEWRYLFIPSQQIMDNSSFMQLANRFHVTV